MRTCRRPFEYAYVFVGGDVRICSWNDIVIGNLLENTLEEIWHSEKVEEIRKAFMRGELLGCREQYCPDCINHSGAMQIAPEEMQRLYDNLPDVPELISLAYDERCNHACPSCRHQFLAADDEYLDRVNRITKNIEPYLPKARFVDANGIGDLFVSTEIVDMLSRLQPERPDFSLFLETNGVLFKKNWEKIEHLSKYPITVSVTPNSFDRETYRYLAGVDDLARFEESMQFISDKKHEGKIARIQLIMVVQESNFRQIPQFIQKCIDYDADIIVLRSIFKWFGMTEDEWLYKNVVNPCHPYHKEYLEVLKNPICKDKRVFNWGFDVKQEPVPFPTLAMQRDYQNLLRLLGVKSSDDYGRVMLELKQKDIEKKLQTTDSIFLYGAGHIARILIPALQKKYGARLKGCLVSCACENQSEILGLPVKEIGDFSASKEQTLVITATDIEDYQIQMNQMLADMGFENVVNFLS